MVLYVFSIFKIRSLKAKYQFQVIRKIIRAEDKDKQLAQTSFLKAMMMLKKAWGEVAEQTIQKFLKVRNFIGSSGRCYGQT